jgi:hypothetical protein
MGAKQSHPFYEIATLPSVARNDKCKYAPRKEAIEK